jgi:tripartite-type tricarboxylate transporter receptor subunit TctC
MISDALAQSYPAKPVRIISPFSPGSSSDIIGRLFAVKLTESWGQTVLVENRAGAGGTIGVAYVAKAAPDGYTFLMGGVSLATSTSLIKNLSYDPIRDFTPVVLIVRAPSVLTVHPSLPVKSVDELISFARSRPGELNYSSSGFGTPGHLAVELFNRMAHTRIVHVPYRGPSEALSELVGGQTQVAITSLVSAIPFVRSGKLRALGVTGRTGVSELPAVPVVADAAGLKGYEVYVWYGLLAPAGTPVEVINKMNADIRRFAESPDIKAKFVALGNEVSVGTPRDFEQFLAAEVEKWGRVIKEAGVKIN